MYFYIPRSAMTRSMLQSSRRWMSVRPREIGQTVDLKNNYTREYHAISAILCHNYGAIIQKPERRSQFNHCDNRRSHERL
jgi:hypothetical protein